MSSSGFKYNQTIFDFFELVFYSADRGNRASRLCVVRSSVGGRGRGHSSRRRPAVGAIPFAIANPVLLFSGVLLVVRVLRGHPHHGSRLPQVYVFVVFSALCVPSVGPSNATGSRVHFTWLVSAAGSVGLLSAVEPLDCDVVWAQLDAARMRGDGPSALGVQCRFLTLGATLCHRRCLFVPASIS